MATGSLKRASAFAVKKGRTPLESVVHWGPRAASFGCAVSAVLYYALSDETLTVVDAAASSLEDDVKKRMAAEQDASLSWDRSSPSWALFATSTLVSLPGWRMKERAMDSGMIPELLVAAQSSEDNWNRTLALDALASLSSHSMAAHSIAASCNFRLYDLLPSGTDENVDGLRIKLLGHLVHTQEMDISAATVQDVLAASTDGYAGSNPVEVVGFLTQLAKSRDPVHRNALLEGGGGAALLSAAQGCDDAVVRRDAFRACLDLQSSLDASSTPHARQFLEASAKHLDAAPLPELPDRGPVRTLYNDSIYDLPLDVVNALTKCDFTRLVPPAAFGLLYGMMRTNNQKTAGLAAAGSVALAGSLAAVQTLSRSYVVGWTDDEDTLLTWLRTNSTGPDGAYSVSRMEPTYGQLPVGYTDANLCAELGLTGAAGFALIQAIGTRVTGSVPGAILGIAALTYFDAVKTWPGKFDKWSGPRSGPFFSEPVPTPSAASLPPVAFPDYLDLPADPFSEMNELEKIETDIMEALETNQRLPESRNTFQFPSSSPVSKPESIATTSVKLGLNSTETGGMEASRNTFQFPTTQPTEAAHGLSKQDRKKLQAELKSVQKRKSDLENTSVKWDANTVHSKESPYYSTFCTLKEEEEQRVQQLDQVETAYMSLKRRYLLAGQRIIDGSTALPSPSPQQYEAVSQQLAGLRQQRRSLQYEIACLRLATAELADRPLPLDDKSGDKRAVQDMAARLYASARSTMGQMSA